MPTYEFKCLDCHFPEEYSIPIAQRDAPRECPLCGGRMKRVFAAPAVSFKGDGFYSSSRKRALKKELDRRTEEKQG